MSDQEWWTRRTWALALGLLLVAGGASGQSLAEAAKREKERRAKSGPSGPSFSDEDLKRDGAAVSSSGEAGAEGSPAGEGTGGDGSAAKSFTPKAGVGAGEEGYWRRRAKARRDAVAAAETRVAQAQAVLDHTQAGIRQPLPGDAMKQVQPPTGTDSDRRAAETNLEAAKAQLARARKALEDLEDEARRKGALPGWLR